MSSHVLQSDEVVLVSVLLALVLVCLLTMVLTRKPDPKMTLLLGLMKGLPRDEEGENRGEENPAGNNNAEEETPVVPGPRSYVFFTKVGARVGRG